MEIQEEVYEDCLKLIRGSAKIFSKKFNCGYIDYWDFFSEGILTYLLCLRKWLAQGKGARDAEFIHYFKTALINNNKDVLSKVYAKKRVGYKKPKSKKACFGNFTEGDALCGPCEWKESCQNFRYPEEVSLEKLSCDGGFGDVVFRELFEDVKKQFASPLDRYIFTLLVEPPPELCLLAIQENRKKMRSIQIKRGKLDFEKDATGTVKPTGKLIIKFMTEKGCPVTTNEYYKHFRCIQKKVLEIVQNGR